MGKLEQAETCLEIGESMAEKIFIDDSNWHLHVNPSVDGETKSHACVPRDWNTHGYCFAPCMAPLDIPLIPRSEWPALIAKKDAEKSWLSDIRNIGNNGQPIPSLDQDGKGYCWAHSSTQAVELIRARDNQPYVPLSAYAVACIIKGFRDQGGFGAESLQFIADRGIPSQQFWPQQSMSRSNDNPTTWANAALHKCTKWYDLGQKDSQMLDRQVTCLLTDIPVVLDLGWWGHSVVAVRVYADLSGDIWNSWGNKWSQNGIGKLAPNKFIADAAVCPITITAAAA